MKNFIISLMLLLLSFALFSQEGTPGQPDDLRKDALNVYMEASSFVKKEIPYINYVRDRKVADVVIINTRQGTGSGGREYTLFLEGQGEFKGMSDTISYITNPDDTEDLRREKEVNTLKMGLMRYILKTPLKKFIYIGFSEQIKDEVESDKWNNWVFRASLSGRANGQQDRTSYSLTSSFSSTKITSDWKIDLDINYDLALEEINYDEYILSKRKSSEAELIIVKSLTDHWSVGGTSRIYSSIYSNYDLQFEFMPGIEYDIFPYSESTRRQLRILYTIGARYNNYRDTTRFFKTEELLWAHKIQTAFETVQKWGSIDMAATWSNYFHDFNLNNLSLYAGINLRVAKGLNFNVGGNYSFIRDQVHISKEDASVEDILLRLQEIATNYRFNINIGLSYTFGSIYNNVVNPRFGEAGRGGSFRR
ncbi:MAG TPA: hypothetical protein VMW76_09285 [Bacteroidales bacterium]|nr:hypothetical protein [Bacteroidales bacterium]